MKGNIWIIGYAIVSLIIVGAAGAFAFSNKGKFADADRSWSKLKKQISDLEAKPLYPEKANVEIIKDLQEEYRSKVDQLFTALNQYERPLDETMTASQLQGKLRKYVEDYKRRAREENFTIAGLDNFYLGMEAYASDVPAQALVPLLDYQLDAFNHLANMMADSGVTGILGLTRDNLPGERGAAEAPDPLPAAMRYPMRFTIEAGHDEFQKFINKLANDKEYFLVLRVLKIENTAKSGPDGDTEGFEGFSPKFTNSEGVESTDEILREKGYPDVDGAELVAAMAEDGWAPMTKDARVLFGQENVIVDGVIDLVRFTDPTVAGTETANE